MAKSKSKIDQEALATVLHDRLSKKAREVHEKYAETHSRAKNRLISLIADLRKKTLDENPIIAEVGNLVETLQASFQIKGDVERNKVSVDYRVDSLDLLANPCTDVGDLKFFQITAQIHVSGRHGHMVGNVVRDARLPKEFIAEVKSLRVKEAPKTKNLSSVVELLVAEAVLEAEDGSGALKLVDKLVDKACKELFA